jgi:nitrogen regulatory protein PII
VQILEHKPIERMDWDMSNTFELVIAIANEGYSKQVMDAARAKGGATGGTVIHARGLGGEEERKFFGISISEEKEIVLIVCRTHCKSKIMQAIAEDAGQNTKAKSFTFSVPVSSVEGLWIKRDDE